MVRLFGEVCVCVWCSVCVCVWCSVGVHGEIQCVHHDHTVFSHTHTHTQTDRHTAAPWHYTCEAQTCSPTRFMSHKPAS